MTYQGLPVFTLEPDGLGRAIDRMLQDVSVVESLAGARSVTEKATYPANNPEAPHLVLNREELYTARSFLDALKGKSAPFWLPTWRRDFRLLADIGASDTYVSTEWTNFTATGLLNPNRTHVALITRGLPMDCHELTTKVAEEGVKEDYYIAPVAARARSAAATMMCLLRLVRQVSDALEYRFTGTSCAEVSLSVVELPLEVPGT